MKTTYKNQTSKELQIDCGSGKTIGVVKSLWNQKITDRLYVGCVETLLKYHVKQKDIKTLNVPGSFELIYGGKKIWKDYQKKKLDAVILIGSIIQGETPHFNFISQSIANGVKDLNILFDIPFIFCVSTDLTIKQALERSGGGKGNKGSDCAIATLQLLQN